MKKSEVIILLTVVLCFIIGSFSAFAQECDDVRNSSLRLHIVANSDSDEDQALKLRVRDEILKKSPEFFESSSSLAKAKKSAEESLDEIEKTAREEIERSGFNYDVKCSLVNMYFETREYEDFTMPAGYYDALRVEIGKASGHNWWCVMFPPMCLPASQSNDREIAESYRREHEIVNEKPQYEIKFAVVEFFQRLMR